MTSTQIIQTWATVSLNYKCPLHDYPRASTNTSFTKSCHIYAIFVWNEVIWCGLLRAIIRFTNVFINDVIYTLAYGTIIARHHTLCQAFCPGFLECVSVEHHPINGTFGSTRHGRIHKGSWYIKKNAIIQSRRTRYIFPTKNSADVELSPKIIKRGGCIGKQAVWTLRTAWELDQKHLLPRDVRNQTSLDMNFF